MPFHVYPTAHDHPQTIAAGASFAFSGVQQFDPLLLVVRVALFAPGASVTAPTLEVQTGTGNFYAAASVGTTSIYNTPAENPATDYVGYLDPLATDGNNVWVLKANVSAITTWNLRITNNHGAPLQCTMVSADTDVASKQPWIDADLAVSFDLLVTEGGAAQPQALTIRNMGTGGLTISGITKSGTNPTQFTPDPLPAMPLAPSSNTVLNVVLTPQTTIGSLQAAMSFTSDDTTALAAVGHNAGPVHLSAIARNLEVAFLLDTSGSMAADRNGNDVDLKADPGSTRWSVLRNGLASALAVLKHHALPQNGLAASTGGFAVNMYPDITSLPGDPNVDYNGPAVATPSAQEIKAQLGKLVPISAAAVDDTTGTQMPRYFPRIHKGATPMGTGIGRAINVDPLLYGYFDATPLARQLNRRWLILMSDGNHNSGPHPSEFYTMFPSAQKALRTAAIAYGASTGPGTQPPLILPNKDLLKEIIMAGGGNDLQFHDANADLTTDLIKTFVGSILLGLSLTTSDDPAGVITAAHPVVKRQISVTALDNRISFAVMWSTPSSRRLRVQLQTPLGELLEDAAEGVLVEENERFRMITVSREFVHNLRDPANARFGTWTLIITLSPRILLGAVKLGAASAAIDSEQYDYQVLLGSRLKLDVELDRPSYAAGDPIHLKAKLTIDGRGVPRAAVTLTRVAPGASLHNWLGRAALSAVEFKRAAEEQRDNPDTDSLTIKALALAAKGAVYATSTVKDTISLVDTVNDGVYEGTVTDTPVPGTQRFKVVATGVLEDGSPFRREQNVDIFVTVRADPQWSPIQINYGQILQEGKTLALTTITVRPSDRFGNVVLIDPSIDPTVGFSAQGGAWQGPIVDNHDGSYTRTLIYPPGTVPTVGITVGGHDLSPGGVPIVSIQHLKFVDRVYHFSAGREGVPGANQHTDPRACLGDVTRKAAPAFVSLGGGGSVVVGISGHYVLPSRTGEDITVFIEPDAELRPYSVEIMQGDEFSHSRWVEIGRSTGVTKSFSLRASHAHAASAVRIVDRSQFVKNPDGTPSATPGASIRGVGFRHVEIGDGDFDDLVVVWLKRVGHAIFDHL